WEQRKLGEILEYEQPGPYIVDSTDYDNSYSTPVLTAGQSFILGYTNETAGIKKATPDNPVIIFDDFTTSSHYVDFSFKVKSSAMKFLTLKNDTDDIYCINNVLENIDYIPASHERHWISIFTNFDVRVPSSREEQKSIGDYFRNLDTLIALHQRKCEQTKKMKKYMLQKMFPQNGAKVPEIRFDGFTYDWEQRKLGDVAEFSKGNGYSKGDLIESGTPIILYGRLYTKYETIISEVDTYVEAKEGSVYSKGGEVIVPASGETAEDIARAATVDKSGILLGGDLNVVMPNKDINPAFLAISISNGNSQRELSKKAQGKSVVHIHNEEIRNLVIPFPNKVEQNKIVAYFANLDHLITLHQRKCDELKKMKKYMLQNMFI
ncbi:restriction endonuclease subunit S, partial [Agathobacter rectalis]|uniref:restriction endonuclease subunit S n=1 Tax=Agathobacter rectalis TaxID=39491 RepID=UPI0027D2D64C